MADKNENKTPDEQQTVPIAAELTDTAEIITPGEQAQPETPKQDQGENAAVLEADAPPKARRGRQTTPFNRS